ncbi:MAG: rod shape-determining protein MreC [Candidatus Wildermuthbacteria bacterium RIFCSPHIGHO2_02_FULL_49_12b]|nr:MAG: rod shape-determining protein MreC [Candidatus Wildermuthbacteria bacterium RIFCSPHIGHO2_02_FULL_49_12b]
MQFHTLRGRAVLISLVLLLVISLNLFSGSARNFFYSVTSPLLSFFWNQGHTFSENREDVLRSQVLLLEQRVLELEALEEENASLRTALGLGIKEKFRFSEVHILARDPGEDIVLINKGSSEGVSPGMPLVSPSMVVMGKVLEVSEDFSKVILLSHPQSSFDAKVAGKNVSGLVKGESRFKASLSLVARDAELEVGDTVVTTKLGGVFPENLLVGTVESIQSNPADPFQSASLELFSQKENVNLFFVITN